MRVRSSALRRPAAAAMAAPVAPVAVPPRRGGLPGRTGRVVASATAPGGLFFRIVLGLYVAIAVTKAHDHLPFVAKLQPAKVTAVLLLGAAFMTLTRTQIQIVLRSRVAKYIWATVALAVLSVPGAEWRGYAVDFLFGEYWKILLVFVIMVAGWLDRRALHVSIVAATLGALAPALRMVVSGVEGQRARFGAAFDSNEAALMFVVMIPLALYLAQRKTWMRFLWYAAAMLMVGAVVRTSSRGGFVGLAVLGIALIINSPPNLRFRQIVLTLAGAVAFAATAGEETWARVVSILSPTTDYNYDAPEGRLQVWKRGIRYMVTNPILGVGVKNFPIAEGTISGKVNLGYGIKYSAAHNSFIEIGAELGFGGLIVFTLMLWWAGSGCRRVLALAHPVATSGTPLAAVAQTEVGLAFMALTSLICLVIVGSFLSFAYHMITYFIVGLCLAVYLGFPSHVLRTAEVAPLAVPSRKGRRTSLRT